MQIKGTQKRMIAVRTKDSRYFEEAYFLVKDSVDSGGCDMVAEAERIVKSKMHEGFSKMNKQSKSMIFPLLAAFLIGAAVSGAIVSLFFVIL